MTERKPLTRRQKIFYDAMVDFYEINRRCPSMNEMREFGNYASTQTPHWYCQKLLAAGWLWKSGDNYIPFDTQLSTLGA